MADRLKGKVALVTGSGRNIGRATIRKVAGEGANVVVNAGSNREEAESVAREAREMGVDALAILADVSDRDQVKSMMDQAIGHFGGIDILISNAKNTESAINRFIKELTRLRSALKNQDDTAITNCLKKAQTTRNNLVAKKLRRKELPA